MTQSSIEQPAVSSAQIEEADVVSTAEAAPNPPKKPGRLRSIGIVSLATVFSRVLGLIRDMVFGALFPRAATDAFSIAFMIPNLLRRFLAEGILSTAFIPVFGSYQNKDASERKGVYGAVFSIFALVALGVTLIGMFSSAWLVKLFAPGFEGQRYTIAVYLTRLMFPFIFLVAITSFWVAILQTRDRFTLPALGPILLNVGIIGGALSLRQLFPGSFAITAMAIGVLLGGVFQLLLQIIGVWREGVRFWPRWQPSHPAIQEIVGLMLPTLLGLGVYQLNLMISRALASFLYTGAVTQLYYADRLMELPLGVVAVAFATVNLPTLARKAEAEDWDGFRESMTFGMRGVLFLCIPAAFGLFILREPVIMLLFERGLFTQMDTLACTQIFAPAVANLMLVAALRNLTPAFFAMKDTRTPMKIAALALLVNVAASAMLVFLVPWQRFGITPAVGFALANTLSSLVSVWVSFRLLRRKVSLVPWFGIKADLMRIGWAAAMMALMLWPTTWMISWRSLGTVARASSLAIVVGAGGMCFFAAAWLLRIPELRRLVDRVRRRKR